MNLSLLADLQKLQDAGNPIPWQVLFYGGPVDSWLDLGSNDGRTHNGCDRSIMTAVELFPESVEKLQALGYREVVHEDIRTAAPRLLAEGRWFERVTATDVIEHIPKADGYKLLADMERIASREIMVMMPIETPELAAEQGFQDFREWGLSQHPDGQRELHDHKSQWKPEDLTALGYQTCVLPNFHGHDGFHFDAFVAVKCVDPADTDKIISQVEQYAASEHSRKEWGYIGRESGAVDPLYLNGPKRIFIGDRVNIAYGSRLEAIDKHQGQRFGGQILIGDGTSAELFLHIGAASRVTIGRDVMIGGHVTILDHDHTWTDYSRPPRYQGLTVSPTTIGDGAWIGEGAFIGKGVSIGEGAIIGAHSVVLRDVPARAVVAGSPARIIKYREPHKGLTSIIIPTINMERAQACIEDIERCTPEPHEIILVDNREGAEYSPLAVVLNENATLGLCVSEKNFGWVGGCNLGLSCAKGDYLLLLNDDVTVSPGWLGRLLGTLDRYPEVGMVGPVTNFAAGPQQVPEGYVVTDHWGETQEVEVLIGFCLLMRREVYERIGGLDERFGLGNFSDNDYSLRAMLQGFKSRIVRDCWVHHEGSVTFRELGIDYSGDLEANKAAFCEKWGIVAED